MDKYARDGSTPVVMCPPALPIIQAQNADTLQLGQDNDLFQIWGTCECGQVHSQEMGEGRCKGRKGRGRGGPVARCFVGTGADADGDEMQDALLKPTNHGTSTGIPQAQGGSVSPDRMLKEHRGRLAPVKTSVQRTWGKVVGAVNGARNKGRKGTAGDMGSATSAEHVGGSKKFPPSPSEMLQQRQKRWLCKVLGVVLALLVLVGVAVGACVALFVLPKTPHYDVTPSPPSSPNHSPPTPSGDSSSGAHKHGEGGDKKPQPKIPTSNRPWWSNRPLMQRFDYSQLSKQPDSDRYLICSGRDGYVAGRRIVNIKSKPLGVTWRGWGTNLAWWPRLISRFPDSMYHTLMDLVFEKEKGLGLNMVRYQIPAGFNPDISPNMSMNPLQSQGFKPSPDGDYDWSMDGAQIRALKDAKNVYGVRWIDAIAYAPPWWMTINGDVAGSADGSPNLKPEYTSIFGDYIADVIDHFQSDPEINVTFGGVTPFNEPLQDWWVAGRGKEGCSFSPQQIGDVTNHLEQALGKKNLTTRISLSDSWPQEAYASLAGAGDQKIPEDALKAVSRFSVHGYLTPATKDGQEIDKSIYLSLSDVAGKMQKETWQTEWGPLAHYGTDIQQAILLARVVCQHINYLKVSAWFLWQAIQQKNGGAWGPIQVPFWSTKDFEPTMNKQFHVIRQLVHWIRPGSVPVEVDEPCGAGVVAAYHPEEKFLSVTLVNQQFRHVSMVLSLSGYTTQGNSSAIFVFRTSSTEDRKLIDSYIAKLPGNLQVVASALTVTTLVIENVVPVGQ